MDTTVRTPVTLAVEPELKAANGPASSVSSVEVPYLSYEQAHGHPHTVEYYKLGDTRANPEGGFPKEVGVIEEYLTNKINSGDLPDDVEAIKDHLKGIEKVTNLSKHERALVKVETIAAYVEFLMKTDQIKYNLKRYGQN